MRRRRCWYKGCRRRKGFKAWVVGGRRYLVCWLHDIELHFLILEWAFDRHRTRKHARYSADAIRRMHAGRRA